MNSSKCLGTVQDYEDILFYNMNPVPTYGTCTDTCMMRHMNLLCYKKVIRLLGENYSSV